MQDEINQRLIKLNSDIAVSLEHMNVRWLENEIADLEKDISRPGFWDDHQQAQALTKKLAGLKARVAPWRQLQAAANEALELAGLNDSGLQADLTTQYDKLAKTFADLRLSLLYKGAYDDYPAIVSIYAGAGGTDAQDWADMLLRMYIRWAESHEGMKVAVIEQSPGEEAGLKSVTLTISGPLAYGKLQGENGVHRLVRLSPFNADHLRQTSFARVEVMPEIDQPAELMIDDKDIKTDVYRAGGHGGQSVNTTDSAVRLTHLPTGITVAIQNERSQLQNRETAMTVLRSRLAKLQLEQHQEKISDLKGPNEQAAWGNQIRNYVLHPYSLVKDLRSHHETSDVQAVLNGKIDEFMQAYLVWQVSQSAGGR